MTPPKAKSFSALFSCTACSVSFWFVFHQAVAFCPFCGKKGLIESVRVPVSEPVIGTGAQGEPPK